MLFDKFNNRIIIKGKLVALDPIHIGSSVKNSLNPIDVDNSVLKDSQGRPVIPGSSIKGVTRSFFESVLRSIDEKSACNVLDESECCTEKKDIKEKVKGLKNDGSHEKLAEYVYDKSCEVCKLFGGREFAGKLMFKDSFLIGDVNLEHRDGVGIDREQVLLEVVQNMIMKLFRKGANLNFIYFVITLMKSKKNILIL